MKSLHLLPQTTRCRPPLSIPRYAPPHTAAPRAGPYLSKKTGSRHKLGQICYRRRFDEDTAVLRKVTAIDFHWFEYRNTRKGISTGLIFTPAQLSASRLPKFRNIQIYSHRIKSDCQGRPSTLPQQPIPLHREILTLKP